MKCHKCGCSSSDDNWISGGFRGTPTCERCLYGESGRGCVKTSHESRDIICEACMDIDRLARAFGVIGNYTVSDQLSNISDLIKTHTEAILEAWASDIRRQVRGQWEAQGELFKSLLKSSPESGESK